MSSYSKKEENLRKKIEKNPSDGYAWSRLGRHHLENKRYGEAVRTYQKATEVNPNIALAWIGLGNSLLSLEQFTEAKAAFSAATECDPTDRDGWIGLKKTTKDTDATITSIDWPKACMGCGTEDESALSLTEYALEARIDPLGYNAISAGAVLDSFMSGSTRWGFSPIQGALTYYDRKQQRVIPILHYRLPIQMYMCSKCNPFNQDFSRFVGIELVKGQEHEGLFWEFGYFRNDEYKRKFLESNLGRIAALYKMEERE